MNVHADYSDRRQIIVFAKQDSRAAESVQRSVDALRCQLVERDTDVRFVDLAELSDAAASSGSERQDELGALAELAWLRGKDQPDFEVVLVGKDGGVKARTSDSGALAQFLALIDTMPMRRAELRSQGSTEVDCDPEK